MRYLNIFGRTIGALILNEIIIHLITWLTLLLLLWVGGNFWRGILLACFGFIVSMNLRHVGEFVSGIAPGFKTRIACIILALIEAGSIIWEVYQEDTDIGKRLLITMVASGVILGYRPILFYISGLYESEREI